MGTENMILVTEKLEDERSLIYHDVWRTSFRHNKGYTIQWCSYSFKRKLGNDAPYLSYSLCATAQGSTVYWRIEEIMGVCLPT